MKWKIDRTGRISLTAVAACSALFLYEYATQEEPVPPTPQEAMWAELDDYLLERFGEYLAWRRKGLEGTHPFHRDYYVSINLALTEEAIEQLRKRERPMTAAELLTVCLTLDVTLAQYLDPEYPLGGSGLARVIAQRRIELGLSRADLAGRLEQTSPDDLKRIENGMAPLNGALWLALAEALEIDPFDPGAELNGDDAKQWIALKNEVLGLVSAGAYLHVREHSALPAAAD